MIICSYPCHEFCSFSGTCLANGTCLCSPYNNVTDDFDWGPTCGGYSPAALLSQGLSYSTFATFGQNYDLNVNGSGLVTLATTPGWSFYQVDYYGSFDNTNNM